MPNSLSKDSAIVIAGAGVFGLSTALALSRQGYQNVTVIDPYPVPSTLSAANDINKIIRTEYHYPMYGGLAREAYEAWNNDSLFSEHFHKVGWFTGAAGDDERGKKIVQGIWDNLHLDGVQTTAKQIQRGADLQDLVPQTAGSKRLDNWVGLFNPEAGWAHSGNALKSVARELSARGVTFIHGLQGTYVNVHRTSGKVDGVITMTGRVIPADRVILAMGACTGHRIQIKDMMRAYAYPLAMIQLSPVEAALYKNMPCLHSKTYGYIFEPSVDGRLKVALPGRYAWYGADHKISRPESPAMSLGRLPDQARKEMRELLAIFLPQLKDRPFCYQQLCWDADSYDDNFVVDFVPGTEKRVMLATGGSYHGFKFFPTIGRHFVKALEGKLPEEMKAAWGWRDAKEYNTRGEGETRVLEDAEVRLSARL